MKRYFRALTYGAILFGLVSFLCLLSLGPIANGRRQAVHSIQMQQCRSIGQALFNFATENTADGNQYPDGNSSTEVFQKLIDAGYATDPTIFYMPLPGKVPPIAGQKLHPENVCFDLTSGMGSKPPDGLPLVFATGYKVRYAPGGSAVPLHKFQSKYFAWPRTWMEWWSGEPIHRTQLEDAFATMYAGNNAAVQKQDTDGTVRNFVSPDFKPDGKTYRQLTPEGELK